jgi:hypothetical protein
MLIDEFRKSSSGVERGTDAWSRAALSPWRVERRTRRAGTPAPALGLRASARAVRLSPKVVRRFLGRHSRNPLAGIHGSPAFPAPRLDAREEIAGMTERRSRGWVAGTAPR